MRFNKEMMHKINEYLNGKKTNVIVGNGFSGATVFHNSMAVCTVEELPRMIAELTMIRDAIEEETGLIL